MPRINTVKMYSGSDDPVESYKQKVALASNLMDSANTDRVYSDSAGLARVGAKALGAWMAKDAQREKTDSENSAWSGLADILGGSSGDGGSTSSVGSGGSNKSLPAFARGSFQDAIAGIESGGRYDAVGPVTKKGDRAIGKYQVMASNVGPWSQEALGRALSPEEFKNSPEAQEAVFKHKFGGYAKQYGPAGAASMWFSGKPTPSGRKDQLGTSDHSYVQKFMAGLGQPLQNPADPDVPAQGSQAAEFFVPGQQQAAPAGNDIYAQQLQQGLTLMRTGGTPAMRQAGFQMATQARQAMATAQQHAADKAAQNAPLPPETEAQKIRIAQAGRTQINNSVGAGETEESKERAKTNVKYLSDTANGAPQIASRLADLSSLDAVIKSVDTGPGTQYQAFLDGVGQKIGVTSGGLKSKSDAVLALTNKIAPTLRQTGSGAQSDAELRGFLLSLPSLSASPGGNEIISATLQRATELDNARGQIATQWRAGDITTKDALKAISQIDAQSIYPSEREKAAIESATRGQQPQRQGGAPPGLDPAVWQFMTPEERALWKR